MRITDEGNRDIGYKDRGIGERNTGGEYAYTRVIKYPIIKVEDN